MSGCMVRASEKRLPDRTSSRIFRNTQAIFGFLVLEARLWSASTKDMPALMLMDSCRVKTTSSFRETLFRGAMFGSFFAFGLKIDVINSEKVAPEGDSLGAVDRTGSARRTTAA